MWGAVDIMGEASASKEEVEAALKWTEGRVIRKVIVVPRRLANIAVC